MDLCQCEFYAVPHVKQKSPRDMVLRCVIFDVCLLLSAVFGESRMDAQCPFHQGG